MPEIYFFLVDKKNNEDLMVRDRNHRTGIVYVKLLLFQITGNTHPWRNR